MEGDIMAMSDARKKARNKYDDNHMKRFTLILNNTVYDRMIERIESMSDMNRNRYITLAILEKLERDRIE